MRQGWICKLNVLIFIPKNFTTNCIILNSRLTSAHSKGYELTFKNICIKINNKDILKNINGLAHPGEMLAIMGPSGVLTKSCITICCAGRAGRLDKPLLLQISGGN